MLKMVAGIRVRLARFDSGRTSLHFSARTLPAISEAYLGSESEMQQNLTIVRFHIPAAAEKIGVASRPPEAVRNGA